MLEKSTYTIQTLLDELKNGLPKFKVGMIFETIQSIFPGSNVNRDKKNVVINGRESTKPLACNRKDKENYVKENSHFANFFKERTRGDFLKVIAIENNVAFCENLSLKENIKESFYENELVPITYDDLLNGLVRLYRRKVERFFNE